MDINLSTALSSIINIDINTNKDDIILPVVPVFCFRGITGKNSIPDDSQQQKKFLNFLTELTKRSEQMGLDKALKDWNGKDYKHRDDWTKAKNDGNQYYSIRLDNKNPHRIRHTRKTVSELSNIEIFRIVGIENEKN
jgi:hypothetical protein